MNGWRPEARDVVATLGSVVVLGAGLYAAIRLVGVDSSPPNGILTTTGEPPTEPFRTYEDPVDVELDKLRQASIAFNAPTELSIHEVAEIRLLVSAGQSIARLRADLQEAVDEKLGQGVIFVGRVEASDVMVANLSGLGFSIEENSRPEQFVSKRHVTTWSWNIEPMRTGKLRLQLTLSAVINVQGRERPFTVQTFERILTVDVTWHERLTDFVEDNWQWLWTALLVPVVGLTWRRRRPKNEQTSEPQFEPRRRASPSRKKERQEPDEEPDEPHSDDEVTKPGP